MASNTPSHAPTSSTSIQEFEAKVRAQVNEVKGKLEEFQSRAKEKRTAAETAAVNHLTATREDIDRRLRDLKATHAAHVAQAKSEIAADVAEFKAKVNEFGAKAKGTRG